MLRVQIANELIGSLVMDTEDPRGSDSLEQTIKRSEENDGVMFDITLALDFPKRARSFIKSVYEVQGIEAVIIVNVYERDPNARKWELYYTGKLDMTKYSISELYATLPITQVSLQRKVLNLMDIDLDLETQVSQGGQSLAATPTLDLEFHAKSISKAYKASPDDSLEFQQLNVLGEDFPLCVTPGGCVRSFDQTAFGQFNAGNQSNNELEQTFTYPWGFSKTQRPENLRAAEAGILDVRVKLNILHRSQDVYGLGTVDSVNVTETVEYFLRHTTSDDTLITETLLGTVPGNIMEYHQFDFTVSNITVSKDDKLVVYWKHRINGNYRQNNLTGPNRIEFHLYVQAVKEDTFIEFKQATVSAPSTHKTILMYEALNKMAQYYTDQQDSFKSDFFGRTDTTPAYAVDGPGSLSALTMGRVIRNLSNLTIFANLEDAFKSLTSYYCLGMGFETTDGVQRVVIEDKAYFYNKNSQILELGCVSDIKKDVALKYYYSQIEIGYPKIDAGQVNGIDEFNTVRRYSAPLTQAKAKLSLKSVWRASGYEIEAQRRLQSETKDSRNDDSLFIVTVRRDGLDFITDKDEDFSAVTNLFSPETAYNLKISPARNIKRWLKVLAAPLWSIVDKVYKFSYGETNYQMTSQLTSEFTPVDEGQNLDANNEEPLWYPEMYSFKHPLSRDEFRLVRENPYGFIKFKDNLNNEMDGYVLEVSHKPMERLGEFKLLRVFRTV